MNSPTLPHGFFPHALLGALRLLVHSVHEMKPATKQAYFVDSGVAIYHSDCREVLRSLPRESVDMVLTDPPYGVNYRGRWGSDWEAITGDNEFGWLLPAFSEIWRLLKPNSFCLSFYGWPHADMFLGMWKLIGFRPVSHLVAVKNNIGLGHFSRSQHETAYLLAKGNPSPSAGALSDVFSWERESQMLHPNQKPLRTISQMLASFTAEHAVVLDPFMGSGTTLVAARNLGRQAVGIEIEEHYCEVAAQRLRQRMFEFAPNCRCEMPESIPLFFPFAEGGLDGEGPAS